MVSSRRSLLCVLDGDETTRSRFELRTVFRRRHRMSMEDDQVVVVSPFEGSPAAMAGIRSGDVMPPSTACPSIRNAGGHHRTNARQGGNLGQIGILRQGAPNPRYSRSSGQSRTGQLSPSCLSRGFGYLRIANQRNDRGRYGEPRCAELRKHNGAPLKGLVARSRNQSGRSARRPRWSVADAFLDAGLIVSAKGRTASRSSR